MHFQERNHHKPPRQNDLNFSFVSDLIWPRLGSLVPLCRRGEAFVKLFQNKNPQNVSQKSNNGKNMFCVTLFFGVI